MSPTSSNSCSLKIITVNDVYSIHNWPYFATCRKQEELSSDRCIGVLPGDFVSPSLLSSLDKGASMVHCMNAAGIDYVSFGNHEADIPFRELQKRIHESNFIWVNTNMTKIDVPSSKAPPYVIIDMESESGLNKRR